jgi:DNA-binding MarR family transcriptional regulator
VNAITIILLEILHIVAIAMMSTSTKSMSVTLSKAHNLAWRKFLTTQIMLIEQIERDLAQAELPSLSWYDVLFALSEVSEHKLRLHELAQAVLLSRSNLTRLVDRLEATGLIQREQCPSDRRGAFAAITDEGFEMLDRMWVVYGQGIEKYFACHLDTNEVKFLIKILNKIADATGS